MILWQQFNLVSAGGDAVRAAVSPLATAPRRAAAAPLRSSAAPLRIAADPLRAAAASLRADAAQLPAAAAPLLCRFDTEQQQLRYGLPPPPWVCYEPLPPLPTGPSQLRAAAQPRAAVPVPAARGGATASGGTRDGPGPGVVRRVGPGRVRSVSVVAPSTMGGLS
jgi:hypothetical protein